MAGSANSQENCRGYGFNIGAIDELVWRLLDTTGSFVTRGDGQPFQFANPGDTGTLKVEADNLFADPLAFGCVVGLVAVHPCVQNSDVLTYSPNGARNLATAVANVTGQQLLHTWRPEGADRFDFRLEAPPGLEHTGEADLISSAELADIGRICVLEDVSRTGGSVRELDGLIRLHNPYIETHTLSVLDRAPNMEGGNGVIVSHALTRRDVPTDLEYFRAKYPLVTVREV